MNCILASTSTVYGSDYLSYLKEPLKELYANANEILFIPFARPGGISHDNYTQIAKIGLAFLNKKVVGIHQKDDFKTAIKTADAIFTGGGNTFLLVSKLYEYGLMETLKHVINNGTPYLGTSAGSNICGQTMMTTNDMPIVYPPSFETLGIVPFNINAHYLDPDPNSTHKGETRETRLKEFQELNNTNVVALREGSWLRVLGETNKNPTALKGNETDFDIILKGDLHARIFEPGTDPYEIEAGTSLKYLV